MSDQDKLLRKLEIIRKNGKRPYTGIAKQLAEAQKTITQMGDYVRLECGCKARATGFYPCAWHELDFLAEMLAVIEDDPGECDQGCCDPS